MPHASCSCQSPSTQVGLFEDSQLSAVHGKRITVMPKDLSLTCRLRRISAI